MSHYGILVLVNADNESEARERAGNTCDIMTEQSIFECGGPEEDEPVVKVDSPEGRALIAEYMDMMHSMFLDAAKTVRQFKTNESLWKSRHKASVSCALSVLGDYNGNHVLIYDQHGSGIRNPKELEEWTCGDDHPAGYIVRCDMRW